MQRHGVGSSDGKCQAEDTGQDGWCGEMHYSLPQHLTHNTRGILPKTSVLYPAAVVGSASSQTNVLLCSSLRRMSTTVESKWVYRLQLAVFATWKWTCCIILQVAHMQVLLQLLDTRCVAVCQPYMCSLRAANTDKASLVYSVV